MIRKRNMMYLGVLFSLFFILGFAANTNAQDAVVYLKNNIHAQQGKKDLKASYSNWTNPGVGHIIIPVNTPIKIGNFKRGFLIHNQDNGMVIYFEYNPTQNMQTSTNEYIELITSKTPVSMEGFSPEDLKGISDGKAYEGMTKDGVRIALGYPAKHRTSSLEENTWIYWLNRFKIIAVEFDDTGKVIQVK